MPYYSIIWAGQSIEMKYNLSYDSAKSIFTDGKNKGWKNMLIIEHQSGDIITWKWESQEQRNRMVRYYNSSKKNASSHWKY
mmetsp:Transcript_9120/g.8203  ORF Transcript_9120/g.8203 Transcript_9120/m.8203 type:complete len:81 (-) Transcript_9120:48-290(-)